MNIRKNSILLLLLILLGACSNTSTDTVGNIDSNVQKTRIERIKAEELLNEVIAKYYKQKLAIFTLAGDAHLLGLQHKLNSTVVSDSLHDEEFNKDVRDTLQKSIDYFTKAHSATKKLDQFFINYLEKAKILPLVIRRLDQAVMPFLLNKNYSYALNELNELLEDSSYLDFVVSNLELADSLDIKIPETYRALRVPKTK